MNNQESSNNNQPTQGHDPLAVANYLIGLSLKEEKEEDKGIYLTKLIKLVYICHGVCLAILDKPLVNEPVEAGGFGPYFSSIYKMFKDETFDDNFSIMKIRGKAMYKGVEITSIFKQEEQGVMNDIYQTLKNIGGWVLSDLTHKKGSPWSKTERFKEIKTEDIEKFYKEILTDKKFSQLEILNLQAL